MRTDVSRGARDHSELACRLRPALGRHHEQEATEYGACAIAICLIISKTDYTVVQRSRKGTGFDYWLGEKPDALFQHAARLEVSGILEGNDADIESRTRQKIAQVGKVHSQLPVFVVIVEFSIPKSKVVRR